MEDWGNCHGTLSARYQPHPLLTAYDLLSHSLYATIDPSINAPHKLSGDLLRYLVSISRSFLYTCLTFVHLKESIIRVYARRAIGMAIRVRELDFALKGHTKVWRLGKRRMVNATSLKM